MLYKFLTISLCLIHQTVGQTANENEVLSLNDTILQFFNNCTCIPYYQCPEFQRYVNAAREHLLPKDFYCDDKQYFCCKNDDLISETTTEKPITETTSTTTTAAVLTTKTTTTTTTTTTTEVPSVREVVSDQSCGLARPKFKLRILNPEDDSATTIPGEVPWLVEIFQKRKGFPFKLKCSGTLIHEKVVLTANHCVTSNKPGSLNVVATGREVFQNIDHNSEDERDVIKIIKHPKYYSGGLYNDIALLILDKPYDFSQNFLNAICLPKSNETFEGQKCIGAGWGPNPEHAEVPLRKVDIPVIESENCQNLLRKSSLGSDFNLHSSFVCAGGEKGKDTCKGDGGGPLMCLGGEYQFVQTGIVSWGVDNKCGVPNQPGLYTDVRKFVDWIKEETAKLNIRIKE